MALGRCFDLRQDSDLAGFRKKKKTFPTAPAHYRLRPAFY